MESHETLTFVDTHAHLTWSSFRGREEEVMENARKAGVIGIVNIGIDVESSKAVMRYAEQWDSVVFAAGIHPNDAGNAARNALDEIEELLAHPKCVALGEIGLDYYRDYTDSEVQKDWLKRQLKLAKKADKPVILHDREASLDLLKLLDDEGYNGIDGPGGVFHCFAGDKTMVSEVVERGFFISFTGNITFKKTDRLEVAREVPLDRLLLETDSPFMAPVPHRGKNNEPAYVTYVAAAIASLHNLDIGHIARVTTENAGRLFGSQLINNSTQG